MRFGVYTTGKAEGDALWKLISSLLKHLLYVISKEPIFI